MNPAFEIFMGQLKATNATLDFYSDFPQIRKRIERIEMSLTMLNYLLGKKDLRAAVEVLWRYDKSCFQVMDILIATRKKEKKLFIDEEDNVNLVHSLFDSVDGVMMFLERTGLGSIFQNQEISNLVDYVFGVETGLDSNARKNRSGKIMEKLVGGVFSDALIEFEEQVTCKKIPDIHRVLGADIKRFDFVVRTKTKTYLIEVNFYSGGGSKLNEVARSYMEIAPKINSITGYEFVWITDGAGWHSAKNKLEEAFAVIPSIYNTTTLPKLLEKIKNS